MSSINYEKNKKGIRLVSADEAWVHNSKTKKRRLNPKYAFLGKVTMTMPNMIVTASDKQKPTYKGDVGDLNATAKRQMIDHFYDEKGKRNKRTVAYFGVLKNSKQQSKKSKK